LKRCAEYIGQLAHIAHKSKRRAHYPCARRLKFSKPPASPGKGELADDRNLRRTKLVNWLVCNFFAASAERDGSSKDSGDNYNAFETLHINVSSD
jgi:hypothetical protein